MLLNHHYTKQVYDQLAKRYPYQKEYLQAVHAFLEAVDPIMASKPSYQKQAILERLVTPERIISFRVPWMDDQGQVHLNQGYRVQHSSLLGPYKGGLRFDDSVNEGIMKFLAFEQTLKNALTGLPLGAGKGGSDFSPQGRSDQEIMRFCQSFMTELSHHINEKLDVPAGDIGVGEREIGYLYGQYKRLKGVELGALTGKPIQANGSLGRRQATGYGLIYFLEAMLAADKKTLEGQRILISGTGNVGLHAALKAQEKGGLVVALSNRSGSLYDPEGLDLDCLTSLKEGGRINLAAYKDHYPQADFSIASIWARPIEAEIALPCATQNEIDAQMAQNLIDHGVRYLAEGANMPLNLDAQHVFNQAKNMTWAPGKASNAGGVAVSGLEMSQNAMRQSWSLDQVDQELQTIMHQIFDTCQAACQDYQLGKNYAAGADLAAFNQVVAAIEAQGLV